MFKNTLTIAIIVLFFQFIIITPIYAEKTDNEIHFETISESEDLKSLKPYYSTMADVINELIIQANEAKDFGHDYPLLDTKDFDFTSNPHIFGIMSRETYKTDVYSAALDDIRSKSKFVYWNIQYLKDDVMYQFKLHKHKPLGASSSEYYKISDGWYLDDFSVFFLEIIESSSIYRMYPEVVIKNIKKLLPESDKASRIDLVYTMANLYENECYIVYVDNKAKYVYCQTFQLIPNYHPKNYFSDEATEEDRQNVHDLELMLYNNFEANSSEINKLYSYNMLVFITSYVYSKTDNIHEYD